MPALKQCLEGRNSGGATLNSESSHWYYPPPEFQIWSGVRELPYTVDGDLRFLQPPPEEATWPLQFMLQVAFTSEPGFLADEKGAENYVDQDPWEFPELKEFIGLSVMKGITQNPQDAKIFAEVREFTVLQRLFRAALDGKLGPNFPTEKLIDLTKVAQQQSAYQAVRTPRWNHRPGSLEFRFIEVLMGIQKEIGLSGDASPEAKWVGQASKALDQCVRLVSSADMSADPAAINKISQSAWANNCAFDWLDKVPDGVETRQANLLEYAAETSQVVAHARDLREAIGVRRDEESHPCAQLN